MKAVDDRLLIKAAFAHRVLYAGTALSILSFPGVAAYVALYVNYASPGAYLAVTLLLLVAVFVIVELVLRVQLEIKDGIVRVQNFVSTRQFPLSEIAYCDAGILYPVLRFHLRDGRRISAFALPQTLWRTARLGSAITLLRNSGVELRNLHRLVRYGSPE